MKRILFILLLLSFRLAAQVQFVARVSSDKIGINERIQVSFIMNDDGDNLDPPSFEGFEVLSGPNQTISSVISNNRRSFQKTYSFILQPVKKGVLQIKPATIEINGKIYKSNALKITVGNAVQIDDPYDPGYTNQQKQTRQQKNEQIFIIADVSNPNPYLNEQITINYKLLVGLQAGLTNYGLISNPPKYENFWSQINQTSPTPKVVTYKGQEFRCLDLQNVVLYPQKSGKIAIDPIVLEVELNVLAGYDVFGDPVSKTLVRKISTGTKIINVKTLPENGKPEDFTGAVGSFDLKVVPSRTKLKTGESLDLKIQVSGKGNLKLFTLPKPVEQASLEMYDPDHKENVKVLTSGMSGDISDNYTIIPQNAGKYPIEPVSFSYFDPKANQYKRITSNPILLEVEKGNGTTANTVVVNENKKKVKANAAFGFIKTKTELKSQDKEFFLGSGLFYGLLVVPFLLIPLLVVYRRRQDASNSDVQGNRIRLSNKLAKKYLSEAQKHLDNKTPFYVALEKAMHNFLKAKLNIETSEMSKDKIRELLLLKKANPETVDQFIALTESCDFARYAPSTSMSIQNDYNLAVSIISDLEKQMV
ncbi:BatD family protein [Flavobacterium sp. GCM10023249]|uniref:BatD family protein n=1 Tax=unclassified Flavobacterium TaxID=196869 RepID=UPI003614DF37